MRDFSAVLLFILIGALGRLVPHPPNVTPLMSLTLIAAMYYSRGSALFLVFTMQIVSDILLGSIFHIPAFGAWSVFTYSALFLVIVASASLQLKNRLWPSVLALISACLFFWLWTNFGVWLSYHYYVHNGQGLLACYTAALPFLRNQLVSAFVWLMILFGAIRLLPKRKMVIFDKSFFQ